MEIVMGVMKLSFVMVVVVVVMVVEVVGCCGCSELIVVAVVVVVVLTLEDISRSRSLSSTLMRVMSSIGIIGLDST